MPAKSKSQQRFMGMVRAAQKGELKNPSKSVKKAAKSMDKDDVEDFASTKHKGKPEKVKREQRVRNLIKKMVREELVEMNEAIGKGMFWKDLKVGTSIEFTGGTAYVVTKIDKNKLKMNLKRRGKVGGSLFAGGNIGLDKKSFESQVKVGLIKYLINTNPRIKEAKERNYKEEYKKYGSSTKAKKYRAELNAYNRKKGTYGNGDGKDASHKGGKIVGFEAESKNRGRAEKSRLKKEGLLKEDIIFLLQRFGFDRTEFDNGVQFLVHKGKKLDAWHDLKSMKTMVGHKSGKGFKVFSGNKQDKELPVFLQKKYKLKPTNEGKLTEEIEPKGGMAKIAAIVKNKQHGKVGGKTVDMQSANLLMKLYNAVKDKDKEKMNKMNEKKLIVVLHKLWSRVKLKLPV